jgi:hypothetical protein
MLSILKEVVDMTISDGYMGTQNINEMEIYLPNHIFNILSKMSL